MSLPLFLVALLSTTGVSMLVNSQGMAPPAHAVWPHPMHLTYGSDRATGWRVTGELKLTNAGPASDIVNAALQRYHDYLFSETTGGLSEWVGATPGAPPRKCADVSASQQEQSQDAVLEQLKVTVANASTEFGLDGDESYTLDIPAAGDATLKANTSVGVLRGLETFLQLCRLTERQCEYTIRSLPIHIEDAPRWTHRGLLVDTGRDYMSVSKLKSIIEAMSWNKMSVLHWHITEMDSFPLVLDSVPQLAKTQSFSSQQVYTKDDVSSIIAWGRLCGVRGNLVLISGRDLLLSRF
jgi:hexosaminidase